MIIMAGNIYFLRGGYEHLTEVIVTAVGLQNVMYCPVPFVYFNGVLNELVMRRDEFEKVARESKVVPA